MLLNSCQYSRHVYNIYITVQQGSYTAYYRDPRYVYYKTYRDGWLAFDSFFMMCGVWLGAVNIKIIPIFHGGFQSLK